MADADPPTTSPHGVALPPVIYVQQFVEGREAETQPRFAVTHPYVERCWLPVIGPSATWCLRRLDLELAAHPSGVAIDLGALARDLGLSDHLGRRAPMMRTLQRLRDYGLIQLGERDTLEVRQWLPPVGARSAMRLTESVQRTHRELVAEAANPLLSAALAYAARGWPVLPLHPGEKAPDGQLVPRGLHGASVDEEQIRHWWSRSPQANVGIRTGGALDVVDFDRPDVYPALRGLASTPLHPGIVVKTARGWHLWFAASGLPTRAGVLEHVDVRGTGGYVVAPPSRHPDGTTYRFLDQRIGALTTRLPRVPLSAAPEWLIEEFTSRAAPIIRARPLEARPLEARPLEARPLEARPLEAGQPEHYVLAALEAETRAVASAPEGSRNDRLNRATFALGTLVGAELLGADDARDHLLEAAGRAGLGEHESTHTIASGLAAGSRRPRTAVAAPASVEAAVVETAEKRPPTPAESFSDTATAGVLARTRTASSSPPRSTKDPAERSGRER